MNGLYIPGVDLGLDCTTKFYIASSTRKIWNQENLILYLFARNGIYVRELNFLNKDSAIATVHYDADKSNLDLYDKHLLPFKFERIFKSYHGRHVPVPISFMGNTAINLLRIAREKGKKQLIRVISDKKSYFKQFTDVCFREIDSDPKGYKKIDFSPNGDVEFTIKHFDHPDKSYSIVTWITGHHWK